MTHNLMCTDLNRTTNGTQAPAAIRLAVWLFLALQVWLAGGCAALAQPRSEATNPGASASGKIDGGQHGGRGDAAVQDQGGWRLAPASTAATGKTPAAVSRTAEFDRSDPRFAGLLLRCGSTGIETVLIVIEPYPPYAKPRVTLQTSDQAIEFSGSVLPTGAGILVPVDIAELTAFGVAKSGELGFKVSAEAEEMNGAVSLQGFSKALEWLNAECAKN